MAFLCVNTARATMMPAIGRACRCVLPFFLAGVVIGFSPTATTIRTVGSALVPPSRGFRGGARTSPNSSRLFSGATDNAATTKKTAIVVGAGPAGLASALMLSNLAYDVTVIESHLSKVTSYNPARAYLYLIDGRGQAALTRYPRVLHQLQQQGVGMSDYQIVIVPPENDKPVPKPIMLPIVGKKKNDDSDKYWIPRHEFISMLKQEVDQQQKEKDLKPGTVTFQSGTCTRVENTSDNQVKVHFDMNADTSGFAEADLVIGADGINSNVRESMGKWISNVNAQVSKREQERQEQRFTMKKKRSPAGGLRYKVLQFPPSFPIPQADGTMVASTNTLAYVLPSVSTPTSRPKQVLRLGMLPFRNTTAVRPANVITRANHDVWTITNGTAMRKFFAKEYPRMKFDTSTKIISDQEWERFAKAKGGKFPFPQSCRGMHCTNHNNKCGVALVGDALHAFPPDVGQGVNSAMGDVKVLEQCLMDNIETNGELGDALAKYEETRTPQVKALLRICTGSNPLQYSQSGFLLQARKKFWNLNFFMRLLLNKLTGGIVPNHSFLLLQDHDLTYPQVMRQADIVTVGLTAFWSWMGFRLLRRIVM